MSDLRDDLADNGSVVDGLTDELDAAIPTVDPAHTTDRLRVYLKALGIDETLPDPNPALDSDGDGIDNSTDVCPFVADPDQETTAGGWGVACDSRLTTIEASGTFACGLLVNGGELTCWDLAAESPGGQPPRPDNAPTAQYGPWLDQPGLRLLHGAERWPRCRLRRGRRRGPLLG